MPYIYSNTAVYLPYALLSIYVYPYPLTVLPAPSTRKRITPAERIYVYPNNATWNFELPLSAKKYEN